MGRLHDQMKRDLELKNYSPKTRACYLASVKSVALYFRRSPEQLSDQEIREYLHYLRRPKKWGRWFKYNFALQKKRS